MSRSDDEVLVKVEGVSEKCLGASNVPDSGRRRHQCLGLIGHNGAGNQAAGQPLGRLPQAARRVRRRGKARINTTLLKMLNGLIKPDAGSITMRGRVGALIALGAAFPNTLGSGRSTLPPYRHAGAELFIGDDRAFGLKS